MALSLPLILFLLDLFKCRKIDVKLFVEKIPFFMVIVPVAGITYLMNSRAVPAQFPQGLYIWLWSAAFYIKKFFWPSDLAAAYAIPRGAPHAEWGQKFFATMAKPENQGKYALAFGLSGPDPDHVNFDPEDVRLLLPLHPDNLKVAAAQL